MHLLGLNMSQDVSPDQSELLDIGLVRLGNPGQ